jgi:hypothetical protein
MQDVPKNTAISALFLGYCWYYDELLAGADEAALRSLGEEAVPEEHRAGWRRIHEEMAAGGRDDG